MSPVPSLLRNNQKQLLTDEAELAWKGGFPKKLNQKGCNLFCISFIFNLFFTLSLGL